MKKFEMPNIKIEGFSVENVITASDVGQISTSAQLLAQKLGTTARSGVSIIDWDSIK